MIRAPQVRVIFPDGSNKIMQLRDALQESKNLGLDLVEISPNANPPVCKIIQFGKFKYELEKKLKESKKHQSTTVVKEIRMTPRIGEHDYQVKLKHIREFLQDKDKVKVIIIFKGREIVHSEIGLNLAEKLKNDLSDIATLENEPKLDGRIITLSFAPGIPKNISKGEKNEK